MSIELGRLAPVVLLTLACGGAEPAQDFAVVVTLEVGRNPHQIAFSEDGATAWVATAGEDRITVVDATSHSLAGSFAVPGTPLGVIPLPDGRDLAVARFQGGGVARYTRAGAPSGDERGTSAGASLIVGPLPGDLYLVSVESVDSVHVLDAASFTYAASYPTGDRPFPGAATSDGRIAFVPGYADGTVTVIDLVGGRVVETVPVGANPSGGVVLGGDDVYAVVVRGENRVAFLDTGTRRVVGSMSEGIGESPFSLVVTPNGRLGFVNNTMSHDISVVDLAERRVIDRIPVPDVPIVMAVDRSGSELWVSSEGVHRLTVISIPEAWQGEPVPRTGPRTPR